MPTSPAAGSATGPRIYDFDCRGQARIERRCLELEQQHQQWLAEQPELREVLHDLMQALLAHKPDDPLAFIRNHMTNVRALAPADEPAEVA